MGAMGALAPVLLQQRGHCPHSKLYCVMNFTTLDIIYILYEYNIMVGPQYIAPILEIIFLRL